jgi:hypothetical protein
LCGTLELDSAYSLDSSHDVRNIAKINEISNRIPNDIIVGPDWRTAKIVYRKMIDVKK